MLAKQECGARAEMLTMAESDSRTCGGNESTTHTAPGASWHVARGALRAADGRAVLLRGVNIASAHKHPPYFGFHRADDFRRVRADWGMNAVRLLIIWAALEPERGRYDLSYLDQLEERLDWASAAGLWVVLDMHQDVYGEGFGGDGAPRWTCDEARYAAFEPSEAWFLNYLEDNVVACFDAFWADAELQGRYLDAWRLVAARFAHHPAVVGFDPMNEPFWGSTEVTQFEREVLGPFYERAVNAVRSEAPGWVAFIEPCSSRNLGVPTALLPFAFRDAVYAPHAYDLGAEAGNGFDPMHRGSLIDNIAQLNEEADRLGAALWIGEYGGNADHPGISEYMDAEYSGIGAVAAGSMYWAYDRDDGYGLLDAQGEEKPLLLDALVRPYPELIGGDPLSISFDSATRAFSFSWLAGEPSVQTTEVSVPTRLYPEGYRAECEGCELDQRPAHLRVTGAPPGKRMTLRILPRTK